MHGFVAVRWQSFSLDELLAEEAGCTRDQVFRALHNLAAADFVEQHHRRWRISPRAGALSEQVRRAIAELHHQYLEDPHGNSL